MIRKKYITIILSLVMSATLTACAENDTPKEPEKETVVEVADETIEEEISQIADNNVELATDTQIGSEASDEPEQLTASTDSDITVADEKIADDELIVESDKIETDWVSNLDIAADASQIIVVAASGNYANVTFHQKKDDLWTQLMETNAQIGDNGIGKTKEGDRKTPQGVYHFTMAFGKNSNPDSIIPYTQVNERCFWVDDSNSAYYNQFVTTDSVTQDWNSVEKLLLSTDSYNYVLATDYNAECIPYAGSAIFLHCLPTGGAGCIAIPESDMKYLLQNVSGDCVLYIDYAENIER